MSDVRVLKILGRDYPIRVTTGEEETLARAEHLLQAQVQESLQRFPKANAQELLVIAALNLCIPAIQQDQRLDVAQGRLSETVQRIREQLGVAADSL